MYFFFASYTIASKLSQNVGSGWYWVPPDSCIFARQWHPNLKDSNPIAPSQLRTVCHTFYRTRGATKASKKVLRRKPRRPSNPKEVGCVLLAGKHDSGVGVSFGFLSFNFIFKKGSIHKCTHRQICDDVMIWQMFCIRHVFTMKQNVWHKCLISAPYICLLKNSFFCYKKLVREKKRQKKSKHFSSREFFKACYIIFLANQLFNTEHNPSKEKMFQGTFSHFF